MSLQTGLFTEADDAVGVAKGDVFRADLFERLLAEEYAKLRAASNRDVHDDSKTTTLPIAREIVETYVAQPVKAPWYVDLLNLTLGVQDVVTAQARITRYMEAFAARGSRITENLDFA